MKVLATIGVVLACLLMASEVFSLIAILIGVVFFLVKVVRSNEHDSW